MTKKYILSIDQGTTSSRALIIDSNGKIKGVSQKEFTQIFPQPGWVEHDPMEIWNSQMEVIKQVIKTAGIVSGEIAGIGITNQRETTVIWNKNTGEPVYNAIVWQDKRTAPICEQMKKDGLEEYIKENTGLVIDSYFSGTKVKWILDNIDGAKEEAKAGNLLFGTIDTWLIWKLTNGNAHVTDYTNASRTMLYNIKGLDWDHKILAALGVEASMLPKVQASSSLFGEVGIKGSSIPIYGVAGDQQAALFGQCCFEPGMAKNTYGTGCFMLMNTGNKLHHSQNGLLTTLACGVDGKVNYALEGSIMIAGAAIQWIRDGLKLLDDAEDSAYFAEKAGDNDEVYVVPAFAGLGAPYWDMYARGAIFGLTRDTGKEHIIKATLQSLAYQTKDVLQAMENDSGIALKTLKVDGGAVANNYLMQFQSDILDIAVERPEVIESTAMGAAYLAGLKAGIWTAEDILMYRKVEKTFQPSMDNNKRESLYKKWGQAVERTQGWAS